MIVATAGHIDHGKTTLVKILTGVDTDRLPEEKARGISIDLGFAYLPYAKVEGGRQDGLVGFVDVPGHEKFVRNMIAGVCGIDFALIVVAADDGVMPQTVEHIQILDLLGIRSGLVAITKTDRVEAARVAEVGAQVQGKLSATSLAGIAWMPVSAQTGAGVDELRQALIAADRNTQSRFQPERHFRFAIDRAFSVKGSGTVVTGTVFDGQVANGDHVLIAPGKAEGRVRQIQIRGQTAEKAAAGQRCALNLAGVSVDEVGRGTWAVAAAANQLTHRLEVNCTLLQHAPGPLAHWSAVDVHIATARVRARVALDARKPLLQGERRVIQLVLERDIVAAHGDRFILREPSARYTIGGGLVLDPFAPASRRGQTNRPAYVEALQSHDANSALERLLAIPGHVLDVPLFEATFNLTRHHAEQLLAAAGALLIGRERHHAMSKAALAQASEAVMKGLADFHAVTPGAAALGVPKLRRSAAPQFGVPAFLALLQQLANEGKVELQNSTVRLVNRGAAADSEDEALWQKLVVALMEAGLAPPPIDKLALELRVPEKALKDLLFRRRQSGEVLRIPGERYYLRATMAMFAATADMVAKAQPAATFTAAQYRDATGVNRTLSIEILEFLDSLGITRRIGDVRKMAKDRIPILGDSAPCPKPAALPTATPPNPKKKTVVRRW